jgi:hypothetical protein
MRLLLPELRELAAKHLHNADFLFVYIMEAHAADEWPIQELPESIPQHRCMEDRIRAALNFLSEHPLPTCFSLAIDSALNDFVDLYCSWPFRYWIVHGGRVALKSMPEGELVKLDSLEAWLRGFSQP